MSRVSRRRSRILAGSGSVLAVGLDFLISLDPYQVNLASRDKVAIRLALAHHCLTIGVECVIDNAFGGVLLMVILETKMAETLGDGLQSWTLGLVPERIVGIRTVDDLAQQHQRRISRQVVLLEDSLKRTLFAVMAQFHIFHIIGRGPFALCHLHHLVGWHKQELGILVHKLFDQPGAGHAVYLDMLTGNPFHCMVLLFLCCLFTPGSARSRTAHIEPRRRASPIPERLD